MRIRARNLTLIAATGDFIVFLLFPLLGSAEHEMGLAADAFVRTVVPFTTAWVAVGLVAKAFAPPLVRSVPRTLRVIPAAWLAAGVAGIILRSLMFDRPLELTFALVSIGVIGVLLIIWRLVLATASR